jgi:hypothetical protein
MKYLLPAALAALLLPGCTFFGMGAVKSSAKVVALEKLRRVLEIEVGETITKQHPRANDYVAFVIQNTQADVENAVEITGSQMQLKMHVRTINPEARQILLQIVGKLQGNKANAFNFTDALSMVKTQKGNMEDYKDQIFTLDLHKEGFHWVE